MTLRRTSYRSHSTCSQKPALNERPQMSAESAMQLARLFSVLASETRLKLLHALERSGELAPTALAEQLGMKIQAVSNQLQLLAARGIVSSRRDGTSVRYRINDPCIAALLDRGWCLAEDASLRAAQHSKRQRSLQP